MALLTAHAKRIFGDALEQTQSVFAKHGGANIAQTSLIEIYDAAVELDEQLARKGRVRNMLRLRPFFDGIERYAKAIDPLCNVLHFYPGSG